MSATDEPLVTAGDVDDAPEGGEDRAGSEEDVERGWMPRPALLGAAAFLIYLVLAILQWGQPVMAHFSTRYLARFRTDPDFYRWALAWTPWAISHGHDPLFTSSVFAPTGIDMTWSSLIPGPAIVMWPVTHLFGTVASLNALKLLSFPLAAWAAYLVCRRITKAFWPSLLGGYLFGFSTYMVSQGSHLNLILIFPIPLLVYLAIRHVEGSMGTVTFVALTTLSLLGLFSIATELFATATLFGGIAYVIAFAFAGADRTRVLRAGLYTAASYLIVAAAILVPYLLPAIRHAPADPVHPLDRTSVDLLGFIVPRTDMLIGGRSFGDLTDGFTANVYEDASYVGIALVVMLAGFAVTERRRRGTWALLTFVVVVSVLSLGTMLHIDGRALFRMPGALIGHVPLLKNATAQRWPMYSSLAVGVIAAIWLARGQRFGWARWIVVLVGAVMLLPHNDPNEGYPYDRTPAFFTDGTYRAVLHPDENVLLIVGSKGEEMMWQSEADFWFRMPQGYVGPLPPEFRQDRAFRGFVVGGFVAEGGYFPQPDELAAWLDRQQVTAVVMIDEATAAFAPIMREAGWERVYQGRGVSVWRPNGGP